MQDLKISYDNRYGFAGNMVLAVGLLVLSVFLLGGAAFNDGDLRLGLFLLSLFGLICFVVSALLWWDSRERYRVGG